MTSGPVARRAPLATSDAAILDRCAELAWASVRREYPYHLSHVMRGDEDLHPPRELTPAFFGAFDWHSAVHGHWCLVRWLRLNGRVATSGPSREQVRDLLDRHLSPGSLAAEVEYFGAIDRAGFERPYGLAWLLQLCAELAEWSGDDHARRWLEALRPLETLAAGRLAEWLPKLTHPIRSGEHAQTAFAMGLALDWARLRGEEALAALIVERARTWYGDDTEAPIAYEPSGHDFLSPVLGEADLMRRVLEPQAFGAWWAGFVRADADAMARWLTPVAAADRADGKLAHFDGLNLSRAWMLEGIAQALPAARGAPLEGAARPHRRDGLTSLDGAHYAGSHWLGSFAAYLVTSRGRGSWA